MAYFQGLKLTFTVNRLRLCATLETCVWEGGCRCRAVTSVCVVVAGGSRVFEQGNFHSFPAGPKKGGGGPPTPNYVPSMVLCRKVFHEDPPGPHTTESAYTV